MKAVVVKHHGGPEMLDWCEIEKPSPSIGEVRIKMFMTSVNFADIKGRRAAYRHFRAPFVPGFDGVGIIDALGENVKTLKIGQRVAAYVKSGSYAEYALADEILCYTIDQDISHEDAASIGIWITSYNALTLAGQIQKGNRVLLHAAAGGIGTSLIQLSKVFEASDLFATVGTSEKKAIPKKMGVSNVWNTHTEDWVTEIQKRTNGEGVNLIVDTIGGTTFEKGLKCLAPFGRMVTFGHSSGVSGFFESKPLHRNNCSVVGYSSGGYRKAFPSKLQKTAQHVIDLISKKQISVVIGKHFSLKEASIAHELFEVKKNTGKIFLVCTPAS